MTTRISADLLNDTLNLITLARETARTRGSEAQAARLKPVENELRVLVTRDRNSHSPAPVGDLGDAGFKTMLASLQSDRVRNSTPEAAASIDRQHVVAAMAASGMNEIDIARQMGVTREQVQMMMKLRFINQNAGVKA